jgi:hypothetical protein
MVIYTFTIEQQLEIPSASSWAAHVRATGAVRKRQRVRYVHHVQNHTCRVTLLQQARRAAVLDQPSSLRSHWLSLPQMSARFPPLLFDRHLYYIMPTLFSRI